MSESKLEPCPFCGADRELVLDQSIITLDHDKDCFLFNASIEMQDAKEVNAWNRRVLDSKKLYDDILGCFCGSDKTTLELIMDKLSEWDKHLNNT